MSKLNDFGELTVNTAGYGGEDTLSYIDGILECGRIKDGVGLRHNDEGGWVIAFSDLEKIYQAAKAERESAQDDEG